MFPKNASATSENTQGTIFQGVLEGTFIPNVDKLSKEKQQELDANEFKMMLDRNNAFFHGKQFAD